MTRPRRGRPVHRRSRRRGGRLALPALVVLLLAGLAVGFGAGLPGPDRWPVLSGRPAAGQSPPGDVAAGTPEADVTPAGTPSAASPSATRTAPLLQVPGAVPKKGNGRFEYAPGAGEVFGRGGTLRRYRVAVEQGAGEEPATFAAAVDLALGDPRSWTAGGQLRLQRVPAGGPYDFTVYLATPETAGQMCAAGGVNIRVGGRPYTSCRATGKVIINLERWRRSVPHLVSARLPLATYRTYVVNHEVGHELGHGHERCPKRGRPAPVMQQQTLFLDGCAANPWPYRDGRRYTGPPV